MESLEPMEPVKPKKVFVSYSRANSDKVDPIVDELGRHFEVSTDKQLRAAKTWWEEILGWIEEADAVVLALSPDYLASAACAAEREFAMRCGKPLFQLMVVDVPNVVLPRDLADIQRVASLAHLVGELSRSSTTPRLPSPKPKRPAAPYSRFAELHHEICDGPLEVGRQFSIIAELYLFSRSPGREDQEAGRALLDDIARQARDTSYLFAAPWRLLEELRRSPEPSTEARAALQAERERIRTLDAELATVRRAVARAEEERERAAAQAASVMTEQDAERRSAAACVADAVAARDVAVAGRDAAVVERDEAVARVAEAVAARDVAVAEQEESAARLVAAEAERDAAVDARQSVERAAVITIVGAALGGVGLASLLIVVGVYRIVPKPLDFVAPNVALAVLGAILCLLALHRHRASALLGLGFCLLSAGAAALDLLKYFHKI